jgi:histidinol-phosphate aminotransferase
MVRLRRHVERVTPCVHGGQLREYLKRERLEQLDRINPKRVLDFSANLNPYGPPAFILEALAGAIDDVHLYPETTCEELTCLLARRHKCAPCNVLVGHGITGLLQSVASAFVTERVVIPRHTYGEYRRVSEIMGARVAYVAMPELRLVPELIAEAVHQNDVVFLCNPNNPTGQYLDGAALSHVLDVCETKNALLVVDEAYIDFVQNSIETASLAFNTEHLVILRSFTKAYAIPGVRVGYALASEDIIQALSTVQPPWSVSVFAQRAALAAVRDTTFIEVSRERIAASKRRIEGQLDVHPSATNFYILEVGSAPAWVHKLLSEFNIFVRDCTSFGLPRHIRFSVRRNAENAMLIDALRSLRP